MKAFSMCISEIVKSPFCTWDGAGDCEHMHSSCEINMKWRGDYMGTREVRQKM